MYIDLKIPKKSEPTYRKFRIQKHIADEFELYIQAVKESHPEDRTINASLVIELILSRHFRKDPKFKKWKSMQQGEPQAETGPDVGVSL